MRYVFIATMLCCSSGAPALAQVPRLATNDNRVPAGTLKDGVLELDLQLTTAMWHPDRDEDPGIEVIAFAESGKRALLPAPLIRVPKGTVVRTKVRNTLSESILVMGLRSHVMRDSVRLQPGETRDFEMTADAPGNYVYGALRAFRIPTPENPTAGNDMVATGGFIVDDASSARPTDRVFVINMMVRAPREPSRAGLTNIIATINGRAWPNTERPVHAIGDTLIWRVINASLIPHPMHLHGFYFDVLARGYPALGQDSLYAPEHVRKAVTERLRPFESMTVRWVPERAGNWLFHCHLPVHTAMRAPLGGVKAAGPQQHKHDAVHGMQNLMMGVTVTGSASRDVAARRSLRLLVEGGDSVAGELGPRYRYLLDGAPNTKAAGPTIVLEQNQPAAITVVNRLKEATAVHWHGIELESFNDGVAGFGGSDGRITPLIEPGDSFVARMTPPRAGTFIYHTHIDEQRQMGGGLYGALLVVPGGRLDEAGERVVLLGSSSDTSDILFNGEKQPDLQLQAGKPYRLRFIHILVDRPGMFVNLVDPDGQQEKWMPVAKDGADLPTQQRKLSAARQSMSNGETYDFVFTPRTTGTWTLETRAAAGPIFGHMTFTVR